MRFKLWKPTLAILSMSFLIAIGRDLTPKAISQTSTNTATICNSQLRIATPQGQNVRIRKAPNGEAVTCLENGTTINVTRYSPDRQWAFIETQWTSKDGWQSVQGWVKTQYIACDR